MPIALHPDHPLRNRLSDEGVRFLPDTEDPPLRVAILNLMPEKIETEYHLLAHLGHAPQPWKPLFLMTDSYHPTHCAAEHLRHFYTTWPKALASHNSSPVALIITGAPVELMPFHDVAYLEELRSILSWADKHLSGGTLHICWAAQVGLFLRYGIDKVVLPQKLTGLFEHHRMQETAPLLNGMDDLFQLPHSRYTGLDENALSQPGLPLQTLLHSPKAGSVLIQSSDRRQTYLTGHPEYDRLRLDHEFRRDRDRGRNVPLPSAYYPNNDPDQIPVWTWRANARLFYLNWLAEQEEALKSS